MNTKHAKSDGVYTVEGNLAGSLAGKLVADREKQLADFERQRQEITKRNANLNKDMEERFQRHRSDGEAKFSETAVGLLSAQEYERQRALAESGGVVDEAAAAAEKARLEKLAKKEKKRRKKARAKQASLLSFGGDDDEEVSGLVQSALAEGGAPGRKRGRVAKNPDANTAFLPDKDRERMVAETRAALEAEWTAKQEKLKDMSINVGYSYWDGTGHRRSLAVKRRDKVSKFLDGALGQLQKEFPELRAATSTDLLFIKDDVILPPGSTFHEFILAKATGQTGVMFRYAMTEADGEADEGRRVEVADVAHPGKVVDRRWYETHKHIFPASKWEHYDPHKTPKDYQDQTPAA